MDDIKDIQYEAACRSCNWDLDIPNRLDSKSCTFSQLMYSCLVGLKQTDEHLIYNGISAARKTLLKTLTNRTSEESEKSLYPILSKLQSISELEDVAQILLKRSSNDMEEIIVRWNQLDFINQEYENIEPVLMLRCSMMLLAHEHMTHSSVIENGLVKSFLMLATTSRQAGRYQVAANALQKLNVLSHEKIFSTSLEWKVEEAKLFWAKGEEETAKYLLKNLISQMQSLNSKDDLYPQCLVLYGNWLAKTRSESPSVILDYYIKKGTSLLEARGNCNDEVSVDAFLSLAHYADGQYQTIVDYMKSETYDAKQSLIRQAKEDTDQLRRLGDTNSEEACRYYRTLEKQRQIDEDELKRLMSSRDQFLLHAVENYVKCLHFHDVHDRCVFRLISLWFNNMTSTAVNLQIKSGLKCIKSYKFISLMYQLAARMSKDVADDTAAFQTTLTHLIETVVIDHPHHCLSIILSLANAKLDSELPKQKTRGRTSMSQENETEEDRVRAAKEMICRLKRKKGNRIVEIVTDMSRLCEAYIQLANLNVDRYKGDTKPISLLDTLAIVQIKELKNVAVSTLNIPVDPSCQYKNLIYVIGFEETFTLAGGINLPKIISCKGSDGIMRRQLIKGKDDLRQDAVMQQVFMMVNNLLHKNPETRKRNLNIRTYKVVPLSQRSGILEWCEGTLPMGEYLIGSTNGAHQRYRPTDLKAIECRKVMSKAHSEGGDKTKYDAFIQVCDRFRPVFHHFFMERYRHPLDWYNRKLSYTRSVATNSIVGYILGLGDRHVQNILIDTQTAELIHIDLGVAFEQGRILPTPETVPFRLTRDIVDGMGVMGIEGVFRRCCEKTMEVMHSSQEVIITILQVLLYDPLYSWTMSPVKAFQLQNNKSVDIDTSVDVLDATNMTDGKRETGDNVNKVAERVLLRLKQKLQGMEDGVQLSISGQVNHLIQEASDPQNLCRLFPGWQAYL